MERDEAKYLSQIKGFHCCNLKLQKGEGLQYQIFIHTKLNRLYTLLSFSIFLQIIVLRKKKRVLTFLSSRHLNVDWVGH